MTKELHNTKMLVFALREENDRLRQTLEMIKEMFEEQYPNYAVLKEYHHVTQALAQERSAKP